MLVRDIPPGERPMDRLARLGSQALKDTELLSIILGGQTTALGAAEIALSDGLERLQNYAHDPALSGLRKARIIALLEIARRLEALHTKPGREIWLPSEIAPHLVAKYSHEPQERLGVVLLDGRRRVMAERIVYIGQHNRADVRPRWILKHAIVEDAAVIIVFHNHPSGDPSPSSEDAAFTATLKDVCDDMDVELFDHIVIGRKAYYSFREHRRL